MVSLGLLKDFLGEKGILQRNRLILTGAVVGAGCPPTSISGVRP